MAKHCGKHDIVFGETGTCWCCDQEKKENKTSAQTKSAPVPVATGGK